MAATLTLPNELVCRIASFVHPQDIIHFACVNTQFSRCALQRIEICANRSKELRLVHDRHPMTVPTLMRESLRDDTDLWYLRSLDVWDVRNTFSHWKSPIFEEENPNDMIMSWIEHMNWPEKHHDYSHVDASFYSDKELECYRALLNHSLRLSDIYRPAKTIDSSDESRSLTDSSTHGSSCPSRSVADKWLERLHAGSDEVPKVLLIALAPKLKNLTFVAYDTWQNPQFSSSHPLKLLSASLRRLAPLPAIEWVCFQNLKKVSVCEWTRLRHPHDAYYTHPREIAPLLLLPRIEELRLMSTTANHNDTDSDYEGATPNSDQAYTWEWEPGRSTCKALDFDLCDLANETTASFIRATSSLNRIKRVRSENMIVEALQNSAMESLETVVFEWKTAGHDSIWNSFPLATFTKLAHVTLFPDLLIDKMEHVEPDTKHIDDNLHMTRNWHAFLAFFPKSLQTLCIQKEAYFYNLSVQEVEGLVRELISLVHAKASGSFGGLTDICVEGLNTSNPPDVIGIDPWCKGLRQECDANKVRLHSIPKSDMTKGCKACDFSAYFRIGPASSPTIPGDTEEDIRTRLERSF